MSEKDKKEREKKEKIEHQQNSSSEDQSENKQEEPEIEYLTPKTGVKKNNKRKREKGEGEKQEKDQIKDLKNKLKKKEEKLQNLQQELEKVKEEQLRQIAEKENMRKRLEREKKDYYQYALSEFLKDLLMVLDNFERALETEIKGNGKSFREGIEMIYKQYYDVLKKQGVRPIDIKDKKFDPNLHQAFVTEESDEVEEMEVREVLQQGYMLHDRLLRPALVKVTLPKKQKEE